MNPQIHFIYLQCLAAFYQFSFFLDDDLFGFYIYFLCDRVFEFASQHMINDHNKNRQLSLLFKTVINEKSCLPYQYTKDVAAIKPSPYICLDIAL